MTTNRPGRIRTKLAQMLEEWLAARGIYEVVDPRDIWQQPPCDRGPKCDYATWGWSSGQGGTEISSWNTMTECVKRGIEGALYNHMPNHFEISAK